MPKSSLIAESTTKPLMRSGAAARLAGLSPSTLRIWEHRYGVVAPPKSASGQRGYSVKDVERLRLMRQLTGMGHAIGTIANLSADTLALMSCGAQTSSPVGARVVVIGQTAGRKLEDKLRPAPAFVFDDLSHAEREVEHVGAVDALVVHISSLQESATTRIKNLQVNLSAANVIVIYGFGAEAVADELRSMGAVVRREPVTGKELAQLVISARLIVEPKSVTSLEPVDRLYSDANLAVLSEMPSLVACECLRHLAEIVTMLVSFEVYSTECATSNRHDVERHRHLNEVAGTARTMFERALSRVVVEEGLTL